MGKILSQSGISLADVYDVEGSIVGVETLLADEVQVVHEMGATIMAERLQSFFLRLLPTAPAQNANFSVSSGDLPDCANRILGATMLIPAANAGDVNNASLSIQNGRIDREILFSTWDLATDPEIDVRFNDDGAGVASFTLLRPLVHSMPSLITRLGLGQAMPVIRFSGSTTGFGAGTVPVMAIVHVCRPTPETPMAGQPSSHGLPLPSW